MRAVSQSFLTALDATERQLTSKVFMIFRDYTSYCSSAMPALPANNNAFNSAQVCDGRVSTQDFMGRPRRFAVALSDGDPNGFFAFPDGTWFPYDDQGSYQPVTDLNLAETVHTPENGYWSNAQSGLDGTCDVTLTVSLTSPQSINTLYYVGDPNWGYPVDATFSVILGGVRTQVAQISGNALYFIFQELGSYHQADTIQVRITRWSRKNSFIKCLEFVPFDGADVSDRLITWEIQEERNYTDDAVLPYGDSSKNQLTINLDNSDGAFYSRNVFSPYYRKLLPNTQFRIWLGLNLGNGVDEWTNRGKYYATGTFSTSMKKADVQIQAWDLAGLMDQVDYLAPKVYELTSSDPNSITKLIDQVVVDWNSSFGVGIQVQDRTKFDDKGRYVSDWNTLFSYGPNDFPFQGVPHAYFQKQSYFKTLRSLATAILGWVYTSEEETLVVDTEFMAKRVFNALTNGDFESSLGVSDHWSIGPGTNLTYAPQAITINGAFSGLLTTRFQNSGIAQGVTDPLGIGGDYTFQMWYLGLGGNLLCSVMGMDANGVPIQAYVNEILSPGALSYVYADFSVPDQVATLQVQLYQQGTAPASFVVDDILITTRSVYSFVGEPVSGMPANVTYQQINLGDAEDKFSVDKVKTQVIVDGTPYRLGLSATVFSWDGNAKIYYGSFFPQSNTWTETMNVGQDDERLFLGRFKLIDTNNVGQSFWATVDGNDPSTYLFGPVVPVQPASGNWANLNQSYYYRATAINVNGESTLGPVTALSFPSGQQGAQISLPAFQDASRYRVYRSPTSFDAGQSVPYLDVGVGTVPQAGWPTGIVMIAPSPDQAGNPNLIFTDPATYPNSRFTPTQNLATKPPVIYLETAPMTTQGSLPQRGLIGDSFTVYPFVSVHEMRSLSYHNTAVLLSPGQSFSYLFTFSKAPVYVQQTPTVLTQVEPGDYITPEGIEITYNNLDDSGGQVDFIGLTLDPTTILYPWGGTIVFVNSSSQVLQMDSLIIMAPLLEKVGSIEAISTNTSLLGMMGLRQESFANEYIQNTQIAQMIADRILARWSGPGREFDLDLPNRTPLQLQIGDKVTIWDGLTGMYGAQFLVVRHDLTFDGGASSKISVVACS